MKLRTLPLPIRLQIMTVDLEGQDTPDAQRWTLGPAWYEQNAGLCDDLGPYYEHGSADLRSSAVLDRARDWATRIIESTSDLVVTDWQPDGVTPCLALTTHIMIINTGRQSFRFTINGAYRAAIDDVMADPDAVFRLRADDNDEITIDPNGTEEYTYIPVRSIKSVRVISKNSEAINV